MIKMGLCTKTWNMGLVLQVGRMMRTEMGWRGCWEAGAQGPLREKLRLRNRRGQVKATRL